MTAGHRTGAEVVVIGGGCAGLSAAARLAETGIRVHLLEARGQLGGRATSFVDRETGERVDNGQHVVLGCYRETFALLRLLGAEDGIRIQPRLEVPIVDANGRQTVLRCPDWPSPLHLVAGVIGWRGVPVRHRLGVLALAPALARARRAGRDQLPAGMVWREETVAAWLERHHQPAPLIEMLWAPLALAALNQDIRTANAAAFVRVLGLACGRRPADSAIGLPARPLDRVFGEPARAFVEARGGHVRTHALARVSVDAGKVAGVDVRGVPVAARAVIAAVPWFALPTLFRGDVGPLQPLCEAASLARASPIVTVNLWYDRAVLPHAFIGLPGRTFQWAFDKRLVVGDSASHVSLVSSGADDVLRLDGKALIALATAELGEALPQARGAHVDRATVIREPKATFSLAPGQPPRPGVTTAVDGLFLASDWVETGLPATIEGAVEAGRLAATAARQWLERQ